MLSTLSSLIACSHYHLCGDKTFSNSYFTKDYLLLLWLKYSRFSGYPKQSMNLSNELFEFDFLWNLVPLNFYQITRGRWKCARCRFNTTHHSNYAVYGGQRASCQDLRKFTFIGKSTGHKLWTFALQAQNLNFCQHIKSKVFSWQTHII